MNFNQIQSVKRKFFAMRNCIIADTLRRAGSPFKIIFGLNLPQIVDIASEIGHDDSLAQNLWQNTSTRESMLLAPMLLNPETLPMEVAEEMVLQAPAPEIADVLCHRLLRRTPYAFQLAVSLSERSEPMARYSAMRILWHFIASQTDVVNSIALREIDRAEPLTLPLAKQICDEISFIRDDC